MKREDLEFLEGEQIDKVMALYGKAITKKDKEIETLKSNKEELENKVTTYETKINEFNENSKDNADWKLKYEELQTSIKEQEAKSALLATKVGQKMTPSQRIERLMPHTLTTKLFDEMANLRLKPNTVEVTVERINAHKPKDKFSALSYGLWRIKELEDEYSRTYKRKGRKRKLIFYN